MTDVITMRSNFDVELVQHVGSDEMICKAARVSTQGSASIDAKESKGLINFLLSNRHGSPFEHNLLTYRVKAPIFVWREYMRHRIGFSYNEQSGRYMELSPEFYIPGPDRALVQKGKTGEYRFVPGSPEQYEIVKASQHAACRRAWLEYQNQLEIGIAKEVARMCLPVSIYSSAYVTCNARSMMAFLSLRTRDDRAKFPSTPQWEINQVASQEEKLFGELFPLTYDAFNEAGRVCP